MSRRPELYQGTQQLASRCPGLSPVFVTLLALWSLGLILARCCSLSKVANQTAELLEQDPNTTRQPLREFYQEPAAQAGAKRGCPRSTFEVSACFASLLRWVLSFGSWPANGTVVVWTDRGLESARRFRALVKATWHPLMRVKAAAKFRPANWMRWYTLGS